MKTVEDLDVFRLSHSLTLEVFEVIKSFPEEEKFGIISQWRHGRRILSNRRSLENGWNG